MNDIGIPPLWFRLPPGFHDIAPSDRSALDAVADALGSPEAGQQLTQLMDHLDQLAEHHVVRTSIGLHPEGPAGLCTSLFALTVRRAADTNPRVTVARTSLAIARSALWTSSTRRFIELPSALPCSLVAGIISSPTSAQGLFQARVSMAHPAGRHVLVLDLTSTSVEHGDAYTDIIEAIAHTVSFSDPEPRPSGGPNTSRILELLL
ncbi:hypothetical protein J7E97_20355 [Streptomyces sp. ISL-66]|uniref:hypothetical protein n=1 Tax=Streptomyces sp. ISL-66 TaxID=2819186 RepID=UPI001BEB7661|nr:hypothetical protein [Streptomyces sp. ISL-66]MBT2470163.1 hypothetical protein [Streptomyces sp. ISL-66]